METLFKYKITELTRDIWETHYGLLVERLLADFGEVEITLNEYGCIVDVCEVKS